jgi:hypothetical protein
MKALVLRENSVILSSPQRIKGTCEFSEEHQVLGRGDSLGETMKNGKYPLPAFE